MVDEIDDPNWHEWLCICRLLMFDYPIRSADVTEWLETGVPAVPGWNRRRSPYGDRDVFTFLDPLSTSAETRFSPPASADFHEGRPFAKLKETAIYKIAHRLAHVVDDLPTLERIERSAFIDRNTLTEALRAHVKSLCSQLSTRGNEWFRWAPHAVVDEYLRFQIPGIVAAVSLATVLCATAKFLCDQGGHSSHSPLIRGAFVSHFADMTYRLLRRRRLCNVGGYYQLSYLASLYSLTAAAVADGLASRLDQPRRVHLERLLLNNEEKACDLLNASLYALPAQYSTVGILKYMVCYCHLSGKAMQEAVTIHNLHPALAPALCAQAHAFVVVDRSDEGGGPLNVLLVDGANLESVQQQVHDRYVAESRRFEPIDVPALLSGEFNPICDRINALLTPVIDKANVRKVIRSWQWPSVP
jgi:hypothetical protein